MRHTKHGGLGWLPDRPDQRDHMYAAPPSVLAALPTTVDLRRAFPAAYDQGNLGSCTSQAIAAAVEYDWRQQKLTDAVPSRLFIYYQERLLEGSVASDSGAYIRDGMKAIAKFGAPHEDLWPYDIAKFTKKPPAKAYADGLLRQAVSYARIAQTLQQLQGCLAAGFPFVFGFTVYESFESDKVASTGMVPMPASHETELGGHAVLCIGYRDSDRRFIVRNSWGDWGSSGNCFMPYEYLTSRGLASDFWKVTLMEPDST